MTRFTSQKFRFYTFVCIALLLFVHGYNLNETYLLPGTVVRERLTFTTFFEYFLANGVLRFRIPMLFLISGYIFAMQDERSYSSRIGKRFRSLIIPFLIWSAIGLLLTFLLQQFPYTAALVKKAAIDQQGDNRPYLEMQWTDLLERWLFTPPSFQLWFIRSLFFYNLLYPVIRYVVRKAPIPWFTITFMMWVTVFGLFFLEGQGLFFFSLGVWVNKTNLRLDRPPKWFSYFIAWLMFIGISIIKTFMAFELEPVLPVFVLLSLLYSLSVIAGIMAMWYSCDKLVQWCIQRPWFGWLASFSFVIYGFHVPLLPYLTQFYFDVMAGFQYYRLATYIAAPATVFALCILLGMLLRKVLPSFYRLATGDRGF